MISRGELKTDTSIYYYDLLQSNNPELLRFAYAVSKDIENPYIEEPGTLILRIPSATNNGIKEMYVEAQRDNILLEIDKFTHHHYSWDPPLSMEIQMTKSISHILDIMNGNIVIVERKPWILPGTYYQEINSKDIQRKRNIKTVFRWN